MSTPIPSGSSKAPPNAATPQSHAHLNAFSSPAPRSVPSPATNRTQAGKSPFHPATGSTPSGPGKLLDASPGNVPNFDSPAGMVPSLSSMGMSNIGFSDIGINMTFDPSGMSGMNIGSSLGARLDDQERRRRLEHIVGRLKSKQPGLSPEGIEMVGQRLGMDSLIDPPRKDGSRSVTLAGETIAVEIGFKSDCNVSSVEVSSPDASELVAKHFQSASQVLKNDLSEPPMLPFLRKLDKFSVNLERLAKLDKLTSQPGSQGFNCFEAINGIHNSLQKLFEHEKKAALTLIEEKKSLREIRAQRTVLCTKSGRPVMNSRNVAGLSIDYWMHKWRSYPRDINRAESPNDGQELESMVSEASSKVSGQKMFSLSIECEECAQEIFQPARISNDWISDAIEKAPDPNDVFGQTLDWQEPLPTYLTNPNADPDAMALDMTTGKLPNIRFVAKLYPPLIVPDHIANSILASVGVQVEATSMVYHNLLLNIPPDPSDYSGETKVIQRLRETHAREADGSSRAVQHRNLLSIKNPLYAKILDNIPFSHPKQIIAMLPIFRQWACINSLLTLSFASPLPASIDSKLEPVAVDVNFDVTFTRFTVRFLAENSDNSNITSGTAVRSALPPSLAKMLAGSKKEPLEFVFEIGLNGQPALALDPFAQALSNPSVLKDKYRSGSFAGKEGDALSKELMQRLSKDLEIAGDFNEFAEWIRSFAQLSAPRV